MNATKTVDAAVKASSPAWTRARYQEYLASPEWQEIRAMTLRRQGRKCKICFSQKRLQVHHLIYREDLRLTKIEDLMVLCRDHHARVHEKFGMPPHSKEKILKYFRPVSVRPAGRVLKRINDIRKPSRSKRRVEAG